MNVRKGIVFALIFSRLAMASDVTAPIKQLDAGLLQVMKAGKGTSFQQRYECPRSAGHACRGPRRHPFVAGCFSRHL
jgi:hypothetical protein